MIGQSQNWSLKPLGDLSENFDGVRVPVKEADRKSGPYPYYGASGVVDWVDGYLFDGDYLLVAEDGENLRSRQTPIAFMATGKFWVNNHAHIIRANQKSNTRYLMYALWQSEFGAYLTGSTMPKLTQGNLKRIPIPAPPLWVQERIADILGSLDNKIEVNRRTNETLEAMARTLFRSWFVDFDPVRAKADGRRQHGLDASTAALFPNAFEDSPLGPIPKGWRVLKWGDIITLEYGKSLRGYESASGKFPVYGTNGLIGWHDEPLTDQPGIIVGRKGAYRGVHYSHQQFFVIDTAYYVKPIRSLELQWAYYEMLNLDINGMDSGSAIPSTSRSDFYALLVVVPPSEIQKRFCSALAPLWDRQKANQSESETLAALRDGLLPKLLSGELPVSDAARRLEAS